MICNGCNKTCPCATCVYNPYYAVNTPNPCIGADCDICDGNEIICFCSGHLSLDELNKKVEEMKKAE